MKSCESNKMNGSSSISSFSIEIVRYANIWTKEAKTTKTKSLSELEEYINVRINLRFFLVVKKMLRYVAETIKDFYANTAADTFSCSISFVPFINYA